jgi:hypothetical protein
VYAVFLDSGHHTPLQLTELSVKYKRAVQALKEGGGGSGGGASVQGRDNTSVTRRGPGSTASGVPPGEAPETSNDPRIQAISSAVETAAQGAGGECTATMTLAHNTLV